MGSLKLPPNGLVTIDAQCIIYTVEKYEPWATLLRPLWAAVASHSCRLATSELSILESLVIPYRRNDQQLIADYEDLVTGPDMSLIPITPDILQEAAKLRAAIPRFRTPDAIHAATALRSGTAVFVTNDFGFRNVPGLTVEVLQDVMARP